MSTPASVLAINGGSSSIKFAVYRTAVPLKPLLSGKLEHVGLGGATLAWRTPEHGSEKGQSAVPDGEPAAKFLIEWLEARQEFAAVRAVGHRVVHGMARTEPARITLGVLAGLQRATPYAPDHLPREIELIESFRARHSPISSKSSLVPLAKGVDRPEGGRWEADGGHLPLASGADGLAALAPPGRVA